MASARDCSMAMVDTCEEAVYQSNVSPGTLVMELSHSNKRLKSIK
jgi:hypothetical protein